MVVNTHNENQILIIICRFFQYITDIYFKLYYYKLIFNKYHDENSIYNVGQISDKIA